MNGRYDFQQLINYRYEMYSRSYLDWNCNGPRDRYIVETSYLNEGLNRMKFMKVLCYFQVGIAVFEFFLHICSSVDGGGEDSIGCHDNPCCLNVLYYMFYVLRAVAFGLCLWMFLLLYGNMTADNKPENLPGISEVMQNQCSGDPILDATGGAMLYYVSKNFSSSVACFIVAIIGLLFVVYGFYLGAVKHGLSGDEDEGGEPDGLRQKLVDENRLI